MSFTGGVGGHPMPILKITQEKVSIDAPALKNILTKVGDSPFALYSINGPKRTGKSFMLSQCIRYLRHQGDQSDNSWLTKDINDKSFEWKGGADRTTMGIDVWSKPFWTERNNQKVALILMDTQGSFDDETTLQQNAIVFAISTLLSSVLIFNIMRDIDEAMLQFFQFFSSYATLTIPEDDQNVSGGAFQKLIFLIRDFQFIQDYKYGYYDSQKIPNGQPQQKNYKKDKVDSKQNQPIEVRFTHDQVSSSFQEIGVYLMPEPDKGLKLRDQVDNMDEDFAEHLVSFVNLLLSQEMVIKKIAGVEVTGTDMVKYVGAWAQLFDGHDMPEIKSIYHSAAESQYIMAKHMAITFYTKEMQKCLRNHPDGLPELQLSKISEDFATQSLNIYRSRRRLGGKEYDDKFGQEFATEKDRLFETFIATNDANLKADQIRKEMEEENQRISQEIEKTKEQMELIEREHEEQRQRMIEEIEKGNRKADDLEEMLNAQQNEQDEMLEKIRVKEQEIDQMKKDAEREKQQQMNGPKIFEKVGEIIDDVILFPARAVARAGRGQPNNCTIS